MNGTNANLAYNLPRRHFSIRHFFAALLSSLARLHVQLF
jgi:hypothetical protein